MANWDERYSRGEHAGERPLAFIVEALDRLPPGRGLRALDLACGSGRHSIALAERGWQVTAVDSSEVALALLRARAQPGIETVAANLESGAFRIEANAWDLICVSFYMQRDLFEPIRNGVKPGGFVAAAFPMFDDRPGVKPMNPEFLVHPGELRLLFDGFELLHDRETEPPPPPGRRVAELFARKRS